MQQKPRINYLAGYHEDLSRQVWQRIESGQMANILRGKYPRTHAVRSDKALFEYVQALKTQYLKNAGQMSAVRYDSTLQVLRQALGTHTQISRVQGSKLKAKNEIRIASLFRELPEEFLLMIVAHELAHLKERAHDKAFYQLCLHIDADYHQHEFDLRAYLCYRDTTGDSLWSAADEPA